MTKKFTRLGITILVISLVSSCKKEVITPVAPPSPNPSMIYTTIEKSVGYLKSTGLDADQDGTNDFRFVTYLVGDPLEGTDKLQFYATSGTEASLLNDADDQSPMLSSGQKISATHVGYTWYIVSAILLAEKVTPTTGDIFFRGTWKDAQHKFLPLQVTRNGKNYNGWIELSFHKESSTLMLHKAAISSVANVDVEAGK